MELSGGRRCMTIRSEKICCSVMTEVEKISLFVSWKYLLTISVWWVDKDYHTLACGTIALWRLSVDHRALGFGADCQVWCGHRTLESYMYMKFSSVKNCEFFWRYQVHVFLILFVVTKWTNRFWHQLALGTNLEDTLQGYSKMVGPDNRW
jgi:hypothetical protein